MKKTLLAAAALLTLAGAPAGASYNPRAQGFFGGDFVYGYVNGSTFTSYTAANQASGGGCYISGSASTTCLQFGGGNPYLGVYFTPDTTQAGATLSASQVTLHPANDGTLSAFAFVAPTAGLYRFTGTVASIDASQDGINYVTPGGSGSLSTYTSTPIDFTTVLTANQQVLFAIGKNGPGANYFGDTAGIQLNVAAVPEPATWAMMFLGFGMVGFGLRGRRQRKVGTRVTFA